MGRDYVFHESTTSICPKCIARVPAKIIIRADSVFLKKTCKKHGEQEELLEEDKGYYQHRREYDKPGTISKIQTKSSKGCPFDCGLCPEHDQHTCIGLIEITKKCNLGCPTCYARSGKGGHLTLPKISQMMDFLIASEGGEAEILQISGGEPTIHPDVLEIIKLARTKKIRYVMLNTNGIRIAEDEEFVKRLAMFKGRFEVYLQFDSLSPDVYTRFRGRDILGVKLKAIANLVKHEIATTLVATVKNGLNDKELGRLIEYGMKTPCIRGVNFQPLALFGRLPGDQAMARDRITLSGLIKRIYEQLPDIFQEGDIIPLPCNVERVAMTFLARSSGTWIPVTRKIKVQSYLPLIDNTFAFDADRILKKMGACRCMSFLTDVKGIIPPGFALKSSQEKLRYVNENTFRISMTSFVDAYNFDMKSMQKECVHVITPDLKRIPFSAYNMFHRK